MHLLPLGLLTTICTCLLTSAALASQIVEDNQRRVIASAQRLLQELAKEQVLDNVKDTNDVAYLVVLEDWNGQGPTFKHVLLENEQELIKYLEERQAVAKALLRTNRMPRMDETMMN